MNNSPLRISVVEDDAGLRQSLATLIGGTPGFACASLHANAEHALARMPAAQPDAALVDIILPRASGIDCVRQLKGLLPRTHFVLLTVYEDSERIFASLKAGASGYLLKRTPPAELLAALREVCQGGSPMSASVARRVVQSFHEPAASAEAAAALTAREAEVLRLAATGLRSKEIADRLDLSVATVQNHFQHIFQKLHARSRAEAVMRFLGR